MRDGYRTVATIVLVAAAATALSSDIAAGPLTQEPVVVTERADHEVRLLSPRFVMPANGTFISGYGYRWGALHGGIDITNAVGTPIVAVADGVVIAAGPTTTQGFGTWVKVRHSDGTVTLYGHVDTWTVSTGQRVLAGDQIATMGARGSTTGPLLHFEVLLDGTARIDPREWLATRGIVFTTFG